MQLIVESKCSTAVPRENAMLEMYFDDSSDQRRGQYYACGGVAGSSDQWDLFEALWSIETGTLKEPFRSSDCECGKGQFEGWAKSDLDDLMRRLVETIKKAGIYGYASVVPIPDFRQTFPSLEIGEAFSLIATQEIFNAAHLGDGADSDVNLCFESGPTNGVIQRAFDAVQRLDWKPAKRLRRLGFSGKRLRPLQAADLIARESFKHLQNWGVLPPRKPVHELSERLVFMCWTTPTLEYIARKGWPKEIAFLLKLDDELPENSRLVHFWRGALRKKLPHASISSAL